MKANAIGLVLGVAFIGAAGAAVWYFAMPKNATNKKGTSKPDAPATYSSNVNENVNSSLPAVFTPIATGYNPIEYQTQKVDLSHLENNKGWLFQGYVR